MIPDLLVCVGCRTMGEGRIDLRTLAREGDVLACACGRRYPIVDGVPIVLPEGSEVMRDAITAIVERDLPPEVAALLVAGGPDDAAYPRLVEHVSIYMDAHWGDRATPAVELGGRALVERIAALPRVRRAVELGCSAGRIVAELAARADHVVGLDLQFATLRRARHMLDGEPVAYPRRMAGRHYAPARAQAAAVGNCSLVCGDALDPPLVPGGYDRVVACNVLDSLRVPRQLLSVLDALCAPGGELVITSPYAWQSGVVDERERIGGPDPAADVAAILRGGQALRTPYAIEDEAELPWTLRRDARSQVAYRVHYLRARKLG